MNNDITIEKLKEIKEEIFNKNIDEEEKEKIINEIKNNIEDIMSELESESEPIDE